jgi:threonine/homoserine/homoserine lactone efflux protein
LFLVLNFFGISTDAGSSSQPASIIPVGYTHLFFAIVSDVLIFSSSNRVRKLTRKYRFWWKKQ